MEKKGNFGEKSWTNKEKEISPEYCDQALKGDIDWEIDWSLRIEKDPDYINDSIEAKKLIKDIAFEHFPLPNVH